MPNYTTNYKLKKPLGTENYDVEDQNENMDIIDTELNELNELNNNKVDKVTGKQLSTNDYTTAEKSKLAGIATGAQINQNAFSNVKVGTTTVAADSPTDTLELVAGTNITLTPDAPNDKVTINNTYSYTHPTTHPANMITEDATHRFVSDTEKLEWDSKVNNTDYTQIVPYVATGGSENVYTATLSPAPTLVAGLALAVNINVANTGASTINVNGLGAKSILKANGNAVASGNLKAGSIYTLRYNGTAFILQGEGGEYGTATVSDVLAPKTIGTESGLATGTMVNNAGVEKVVGSNEWTDLIPYPSDVNYGQLNVPIPSVGYYNKDSVLKINIANLNAANIKAGVKMGRGDGTKGIVGTFTADATAVAADILSGKSAYVNGAKVPGSLTDYSGSVDTIANPTAAITSVDTFNSDASGYFGYIHHKLDVTGKVNPDTVVRQTVYGLNPAVIKAGQIIGPYGSTTKGTFTADATATAAHIRAGQSAYVNGAKVAGALAVQATTAQTITPGTANIVKPAGIYDGAITILGSPHLLSSNIVKGVTLFNVPGSLVGGLTAVYAGDYVIYSNAGGTTNSETMAAICGATIRIGGTIRVRFTGKQVDPGYTYISTFRIYKNGVAVGIERTLTSSYSNSSPSATWIEDISVQAGDSIYIYGKTLSYVKIAVTSFELAQSVGNLYTT